MCSSDLIDPLARPQSLFELQKLLAQAPAPKEPPPPPGELEKLGKLAASSDLAVKKTRPRANNKEPMPCNLPSTRKRISGAAR